MSDPIAERLSGFGQEIREILSWMDDWIDSDTFDERARLWLAEDRKTEYRSFWPDDYIPPFNAVGVALFIWIVQILVHQGLVERRIDGGKAHYRRLVK